MDKPKEAHYDEAFCNKKALKLMYFHQEQDSARYQIQAYELGRITINNEHYQSSVILSSGHLIHPWRPRILNELHTHDLSPIIEIKPDIVLLGTGAQLVHPEQALLHNLLSQGIGVEVMDTAAACRTFKILSAEDRKVVAALLIE